MLPPFVMSNLRLPELDKALADVNCGSLICIFGVEKLCAYHTILFISAGPRHWVTAMTLTNQSWLCNFCMQLLGTGFLGSGLCVGQTRKACIIMIE